MCNVFAEIAVLGGGPAGYVAAIRAAQLGANVILIEKNSLGGLCLNEGCIPTKALVSTSNLLLNINRAREHGITNEFNNLDWQSVVARKDRIVRRLRTGLEQLLHAHKIIIIKGEGKIISSHEIIVATEKGDVSVCCQKMILASGSSPKMLSIPGANLTNVLTSKDMLGLTSLPSSLIIIGAGVIGLEFASIFSVAGVKVTIIEKEDRLLPDIDEEAALGLLKHLKQQGVVFQFGTDVQRIEKKEDVLIVSYCSGGHEQSVVAHKVLMAVGRKLNSDICTALPLTIKQEAIVVNGRMETSVPDVYASGDVVGGNLLAHLAFAEGRTAAENAVGLKRSINYKAVPSCIYTHPEFATVGLTEVEAFKRDIEPRIGKFFFKHNGRALSLGEGDGYVKVVADENNVIIGAQILGPEASEMISEMTLAITLGAKADVLADMIHPHPARNEALWEACASIAGRPVHSVV